MLSINLQGDNCGIDIQITFLVQTLILSNTVTSVSLTVHQYNSTTVQLLHGVCHCYYFPSMGPDEVAE